MANEMFLNMERAIPTAPAPSVRREEAVLEALSSSRNILGFEATQQLPFMLLMRLQSLRKFNTTGRNLLIKFRSPGEEQETSTYLKECITALNYYLVDEVNDRDLVGLRKRNTENVQDKVVGISFRRREQLKPDLVWEITSKVIQSNVSFSLTDHLEVHLDRVRMPAGNGRMAERTNFRCYECN